MTVADFLTNECQTVLWSWLHERIGLPWSTDFIALGRVQDGKIIGVVGYTNFTGTSCHMHMAGEGRWMTRQFLHEAFRYPFETLHLTMVLGVVPSGNTRALGIDRKLGFRELLYVPDAHPDGGIHILQMKRPDCRWLRNHDGKEKPEGA
jgi:RimJ/RimL family protein N-acetyltransferase